MSQCLLLYVCCPGCCCADGIVVVRVVAPWFLSVVSRLMLFVSWPLLLNSHFSLLLRCCVLDVSVGCVLWGRCVVCCLAVLVFVVAFGVVVVVVTCGCHVGVVVVAMWFSWLCILVVGLCRRGCCGCLLCVALFVVVDVAVIGVGVGESVFRCCGSGVFRVVVLCRCVRQCFVCIGCLLLCRLSLWNDVGRCNCGCCRSCGCCFG